MVRTKNATFFFFWLTLSVLNPLCSETCDIFNIWRHYSSAYSPGQKVSISLNGIKVLRHTPKHASHKGKPKGNGASVSCILGMCALVKLSCVQPTCFYEFVFCTLCRVCVLVRCHLTRDKLNPSHSSFPPPPRSPSRDSRFALHFTLQRDAQWSVFLTIVYPVSSTGHMNWQGSMYKFWISDNTQCLLSNT